MRMKGHAVFVLLRAVGRYHDTLADTGSAGQRPLTTNPAQ